MIAVCLLNLSLIGSRIGNKVYLSIVGYMDYLRLANLSPFEVYTIEHSEEIAAEKRKLEFGYE